MFAVAVVFMATGLYSGMQTGLGTLHGHAATITNCVLMVQFPILHSLFLSSRGRRALARIVPFGEGRRLAATAYATFASLQVLVTFMLWSPSGAVLWRPTAGVLVLAQIAFVSSWLFLMVALVQSGLGLQTGSIGWRALLRNEQPRYPKMPQTGLFSVCRQPIYLGFGLLLWTGPVWTPDHLLLACTWSAYCLLGPLLKERRFRTLYGETFVNYQRAVPYILPRLLS